MTSLRASRVSCSGSNGTTASGQTGVGSRAAAAAYSYITFVCRSTTIFVQSCLFSRPAVFHFLSTICCLHFPVVGFPSTLVNPLLNASCMCVRASLLCVNGMVRVEAGEPRAGSGVVRIDPLRFLAGCRKRRLNQALSVLSHSIGVCLYIHLYSP